MSLRGEEWQFKGIYEKVLLNQYVFKKYLIEDTVHCNSPFVVNGQEFPAWQAVLWQVLEQQFKYIIWGQAMKDFKSSKLNLKGSSWPASGQPLKSAMLHITDYGEYGKTWKCVWTHSADK